MTAIPRLERPHSLRWRAFRSPAFPVPTFGMVASKFMELRKRRGLMIAIALVTIGIPSAFLLVRLLLHAAAPKTYGPAGGYDTYTALTRACCTSRFIMAATLGATAGSADLTEGCSAIWS